MKLNRAGQNLFLLFLLTVFVPASIKASPFKRIEITKTNNYFTGFNSDSYRADAVSEASLNSLRQYVGKRIRLNPKDDPGVIIQALQWVSLQWKQDGVNEPRKGESALDILKDVHEKGQRYRCVEYSLVLVDILRSLGYVSRKLSLRSVDVAYGPGAEGHIAVEVWSNHLQKWIFIDPQFSIYPTYRGRYLDYYEIYQLKKQGKFSKIKFNVTQGYQKRQSKFNLQGYQRDYQKFLAHYFGYMATPIVHLGKNYNLVLELNGKRETMTFQASPEGNNLFTRNWRDLYFDVNRTMINFQYHHDGKSDYQALLKQNGIAVRGDKTDKEIEAKLAKLEPLFAAKPDFNVSFLNNSPWHSYYEYRFSEQGPWLKIKGDSIIWNLKSGRNDLEARSVNRMDIPGPTTFVHILYR